MRSGIAASDPLVRDRIIKDLFSQGPTGAFLSTVFARPDPVNSYDSVANQAQMLRNDMYSAYMQPNTNDLTDKRIRHISGMLGMGSAGVKMMKSANNFAPGIMEMVLGHHGGMAAQMNIVNSANAIGAVRSGFMGGMADPQQMNANQQLGMRIAMEAYRNNFDKSGGVDIGQTRGLSLDQAVLNSNRVLQDKSVYESFAQKAKSIDPRLTESEIKNFTSGSGATDRVVKAFSQHIKQFTKEINAFTASVTKMTGDFEETINFMQRATGGQLYKDTDSASKLRKDAVRMANNLRIIAADAGMNPQELYMHSGLMGGIFESSQGRTNAFATHFANKVSGTRLGMIGAAAFANYVKHNPNATNEERGAAQNGIAANVADYGSGDLSKMNVVLSRFVDEGKVTKEEAERLAGTGNAEQMAKFLATKVGGKTNLDKLLSNGRTMASWRHRYSKTLADLDEIGFSKALARERLEKGGRNRMDDELSFLANTAGDDRQDTVRRELKNITNEAFMNADILKSAGMTDDQAHEFARKASTGMWGRERILDEVSAYTNVDTLKLTREAYKEVSRRAQDSDVLTAEEKESIEKARKDSFGREVNEEDMKKARKAVANKALTKSLQEVKARWSSAKTMEERHAILGKTSEFYNAVLEGKARGYSLFASPDTASGGANVEAVLASGTTFKEKDEKNPQRQQDIIQMGKKAYSRVLEAGGSEEAAWKAAAAEMQKRGAASVDVSPEARKRAISIDTAQSAAENVMLRYLEGSNISDEDKKSYSTKIQAKVKSLMKDNPNITEEQAINKALKSELSLAKDKDGLDIRAGGIDAFLKNKKDTVSKAVESAYMDKYTGITFTKNAQIPLDDKGEAEAKELAERQVLGENADDVNSFSAGTKTEDAANASRGMGKFTTVIEEATGALKNLTSAAQVLASDQRDAKNQNEGFLDRMKLGKEKRDAMLAKYGLDEENFGRHIDFRNLTVAAIRAGSPLLDGKTNEEKNKFFQEGFKEILGQEGLDFKSDKAVIEAVDKKFSNMGTGATLKALQGTLNYGKDKGDIGYRSIAEIIAGYSAGDKATLSEKGEQALAQKVKIDGINADLGETILSILREVEKLAKNT